MQSVIAAVVEKARWQEWQSVKAPTVLSVAGAALWPQPRFDKCWRYAPMFCTSSFLTPAMTYIWNSTVHGYTF